MADIAKPDAASNKLQDEPAGARLIHKPSDSHNGDDDHHTEGTLGRGRPRSSESSGIMAESTTSVTKDSSTSPPRPSMPSRRGTGIGTERSPISSVDSLRGPRGGGRPALQGKATTALSLAGIHTQVRTDAAPPTVPKGRASSIRRPSHANLERTFTYFAGDNSSVRSYAPTLEAAGEDESFFGGFDDSKPVVSATLAEGDFFKHNDVNFELEYEHEFDDIDELDHEGLNEEFLMAAWRSKLKHYVILSAAGKPIWSRHGDDQLISNSIGVIQTIISFYQDAADVLKGFTAGDSRFVILSKDYLHLVAISRLDESDSQLRAQLEALYMQVLSTLTLPSMQRQFQVRPSTDLRRPLEGTEKLLCALADGFTRGSPSTLLSSLECLRIRKTHRQMINSTMLKVRTPNLLYGLIVAGGRLVSVLRPKKHSLHPGDLHLIFNMLFAVEGTKAGGGENWIPLCLPGFNNTGYLYMYASFLRAELDADNTPTGPSGSDNDLAILFISATRDAFDELRAMRSALVEQMTANGSMAALRTALAAPRPSCTAIAPGTPLRHFLYKSRAHVQFVMPNPSPQFSHPLAWRRLMSAHGALHSAAHGGRGATHLKLHHAASDEHVGLAWIGQGFELYCIADPNTGRPALAKAAQAVIKWAKREEERLFIVGGAVF